MRTAVIDIGTNSTRLLVADVGPDGGVTERVRESHVTRLGEGVEAGGRLGEAPQARVLAVLDRYAGLIRAAGCERGRAVMTSAVRDAANGREFAAAVTEHAGIEGRIIDGDEEAALTFAGATHDRDPDGLLLIDIGGGSTELITEDWHVSLQVGVVRHGERHLRHDPPLPAELAALSADVRAQLDPPAGLGVDQAVAVAGTATSCAAIDLGLVPYDAARVEGHVLGLARLRELLDRLAALPLAARREVHGLHPDRAIVIVPGIVVLLEILGAFGLEQVEASERDILHGVARALAIGDIPPIGEPK